MPVSVTPVRGKDDLEAFQRVPYRIYADDPHYVYPLLGEQRKFLDQRTNPFFAHAEACLWIARQDGRAVGRVAACIDRYHNEAHRENSGFFGFYESPPDPEISGRLLQAAADWLTERGIVNMRGPCCFTTNHDYLGLLIEGEPAPPVVGMPYNPDYYPDQLADFGLLKSKDLWAWQMKPGALEIPEKIQSIIDKLLKSDAFTVRPFDMKRFEQEASTVRKVYNAAWSKNWGFIPMDDEEFAYAAKDMKKMVNPDLLLIAEAQGRPIGFSLTIPDFNIALKPCRGNLYPFGFLKFLWHKRRIRYARTLLMGVLPEFRHRGVDVVMVYKTFKAGYALGYNEGECSWVLEDNLAMNRVLQSLGARVYKKYRIYDKPLS